MNVTETLAQYHFDFPQELIAQMPAQPRHKARLLVYERKTNQISFNTFGGIGAYLPKNAVLVFNQTKVVPARLAVVKHSGGKANLLYIGRKGPHIQVIADRKLTVGANIFLVRSPKKYFTVVSQQEQFYFLKPSFTPAFIAKILEQYGTVPLPPYIKRTPLTETETKKQYQFVFAKKGLSVAAPTAGLHFTQSLLRQLRKVGITICFITLNVNLGTFAPLRAQQLTSGKLHSEEYSIDSRTLKVLNTAIKNHKKIIAVGTTVVRTLESAAVGHTIKKQRGQTQLFIRPGYQFKVVDGLVTNFHVPHSSLLMLVAALTGREKLLALYNLAILQRFRLFSFGDGMLIL